MEIDIHPFFTEIKNHSDLAEICRLDITKLPSPHRGENKIKAILIGADPTNNGTKANPGQMVLHKVFGIGQNCENDFFRPQLSNLKAFGLDKEDIYIQNLCRNYFVKQTAENKEWNKVAELWVKYLINEIEDIDPKVPLLVTAEKIMKIFFPKVLKASILYGMESEFSFHSEVIGRDVYPFYRHYKYNLNNSGKYRGYLMERLSF